MCRPRLPCDLKCLWPAFSVTSTKFVGGSDSRISAHPSVAIASRAIMALPSSCWTGWVVRIIAMPCSLRPGGRPRGKDPLHRAGGCCPPSILSHQPPLRLSARRHGQTLRLTSKAAFLGDHCLCLPLRPGAPRALAQLLQALSQLLNRELYVVAYANDRYSDHFEQALAAVLNGDSHTPRVVVEALHHVGIDQSVTVGTGVVK